MHLNDVLLFVFIFVIRHSDQCHPPRISQHITVAIGAHVDFPNGDLISTKWCYRIPRFCLEFNGIWTAAPNSENDIGDYVLNYRPRPHNTSSGIMLHVVKNDTIWMARQELHKGYSKTQIDLASIHRRIMASIPDKHEVGFPMKKDTTTATPSTNTWLAIVFPPTQTRHITASPEKEILDSSADEHEVPMKKDTTTATPSTTTWLAIVFPPTQTRHITASPEKENLDSSADVELPATTTTTGPSWHPIVFPPSAAAASPSEDIANPSANEFNIKADTETTSETTARTSTAYTPIVFPPKTSESAAIPVRSSEVEMTVQEADRIWNILMIGVILAFMLIAALILGAFFYCH